MELAKHLNWRYAAKRMMSEKTPKEKLEYILEAIRLSVSPAGCNHIRFLWSMIWRPEENYIRLLTTNHRSWRLPRYWFCSLGKYNCRTDRRIYETHCFGKKYSGREPCAV